MALDAAASALVARAGHLHVMGSSLFSAEIIAASQAAIGRIKADGGTVSFDPNVRKEMIGASGNAGRAGTRAGAGGPVLAQRDSARQQQYLT